ncbi:MAG: transaldolase [Chlorobi bacterium]|nr:transaldolase [Chlorobiota bacterium]
MNILHELHTHGQSIWYDFIGRNFITSGRMKELVEKGIRGMTSNPTIFEGAIAGGEEYDEQIASLDGAGKTTGEIATELFMTDVRGACDVLRPLFDQSNGSDGYISLEVSPTLANNTEGSIEEAIRLWKGVDRPNLMMKIPATPEGYPAIQECIAEGININITLIFSVEQYRQVVEAYLSGLEARLRGGRSIDHVSSVASLFVSRIDSMIDGWLERIGSPEALALRGKAGLANSKLVYQEFQRLFSAERWDRLRAEGANLQRPLWASTSTKNPDYPDLLYVDNLIGPNTVNTVPPATLESILDHGIASSTIEKGMEEAEETMRSIEEAGVSLEKVMDDLLDQGVEKFAASFTSLFEKIEAKREQLRQAGIAESS